MKIVEYALALRNVIVHKTLLASTVIALTCAPSLGGERQFSGLWGRSGEKWQPQSRLPDFSYAGYHRGERPLPTRSGDLSVKDFGAVGDGRSDDTEPFKKAIEAGKGKVILIPAGHYKGHFTEARYNALAMSGVRNCWARNLWIRNADSGIFTGGSNITLQNIQIDSQREVDAAGHATGHHSIILGGQDHLLKEFEFRTRFLHDVTVTAGCTGNVASSSRGVDLTLDHHRRCPHSNLFTHIDLGDGSRMFLSGGGAALGRHSAAHETFWCIRARRPQAWLAGWGPDLMNLVGVATDQPSVTEPEGKWFEAIEPDALYPRDLYQAQLDRPSSQILEQCASSLRTWL